MSVHFEIVFVKGLKYESQRVNKTGTFKKGKWITKRDWRIMGRLTIAQPKNSCSKFIFNSHTENSNASMPLRFNYEWFSNNILV